MIIKSGKVFVYTSMQMAYLESHFIKKYNLITFVIQIIFNETSILLWEIGDIDVTWKTKETVSHITWTTEKTVDHNINNYYYYYNYYLFLKKTEKLNKKFN